MWKEIFYSDQDHTSNTRNFIDSIGYLCEQDLELMQNCHTFGIFLKVFFKNNVNYGQWGRFIVRNPNTLRPQSGLTYKICP